jgi:hypothetical protein
MTRLRVGAGALALLALGLYAGVARPLESRALTAGEEYRRARDERRDARARAAELERRAAARARAAAVLAAAGSVPGGGVREVRRGVVDIVTRSRVSSVRLGVRPGRPPASASVSLSAEGPFADVVRLTGELARPGSGLVLDRVRLVSRPPRVGVDVSASGLGVGP